MMKKVGILSGMALLFAATTAQSATILDEYVGAGYGSDVLGNGSKYQVNFMDVEIVGSILTVSINTTFAGNGDNGFLSSNTVGGNGIGYGDLFISGAWNPFGTADYKDDDASNGTVWSHGFSLDDRWMHESEAGTGVLYGLTSGDNDTDIKLSDDFFTRGSFRSGQEVAVDRNSAGAMALGNAGSWLVTADTVEFTIDLAGTGLLAGSEIALRWQMSCANDIIEGAADVPPIPVPAAVWLFGSGLIGLVAIARRKER